jgi:hypothetical protein
MALLMRLIKDQSLPRKHKHKKKLFLIGFSEAQKVKGFTTALQEQYQLAPCPISCSVIIILMLNYSSSANCF